MGRDTSVTVNGKFIPSITVTTPSAYNFSHSYLKDSRFYRLENEIIDFIDTQLRPFALLVDGIETQTDAIFVDVRGLEGKISALRTDLNTITAGLTLLEGLTWPTQCRCQETVSSPPVVEQPNTPPQSITNSETCETPDPDTGQCTKRCPANSQVDFRGECECKRSFKEDAGGQCVPTGCPANSRWYDYIQKCKCRADHKEVGGQCVSVNCPANSRWYVDKCECDYEYKEVGGQCVSANCPAKSYWSKSDQKCKCLGNYEEVGGQCQSRGCKGYASWDSNASQCVCLSDQYIKTSQSSCKRRCPRGEVYREGRCCKIEIPPELR